MVTVTIEFNEALSWEFPKEWNLMIEISSLLTTAYKKRIVLPRDSWKQTVTVKGQNKVQVKINSV